MSLEKIETVENPLLERTEISALFDSKSGSLTRKEAIDLISKKLVLILLLFMQLNYQIVQVQLVLSDYFIYITKNF